MPANKMTKDTKLNQTSGNAGLKRYDPPHIKGNSNKMTTDVPLLKDKNDGGLSAYKPPTK